LFTWGGEGAPGGVDRKVKKSVSHVTLKDRVLQQLGQVFEGDGSGVSAAVKQDVVLELPRCGGWWGKPR
jgi:hypothetical protein